MTVKNKVLTYAIIRMLLGTTLIVHAVLSIFSYQDFLVRLDDYFDTTQVFNNLFLRLTAPLVPFEEFAVGLFIATGLFTKNTLKIGSFLLLFFAAFLWSAGELDRAILHFGTVVTMMILLYNNEYNLYSLDWHNNTYIKQQ
ncbi:MauE/DoxX family redox-associated membrane protein [Sungkyunkwania multivorans]|uniref:MauE/DoxX family redox-associated membrane protein n=1 Tax=Sungkyunkwania multivorans TaxID=1173618 RepID=A0ABW3CTU3_9FLAO